MFQHNSWPTGQPGSQQTSQPTSKPTRGENMINIFLMHFETNQYTVRQVYLTGMSFFADVFYVKV